MSNKILHFYFILEYKVIEVSTKCSRIRLFISGLEFTYFDKVLSMKLYQEHNPYAHKL